jgi:hypothetical protein
VKAKRLVPFVALLLFFALGSPLAFTCPQDAGPSTQSAPARNPAAAKSSSAKSPSGASASEIAAAKASGQVWVNLDSGVYHKGGRWYGKTRNGRFLSEDEAKKAGYKPSRRD